LFATMLLGPRIITGFKTPPRGLFLTCRGEKYVQYIQSYTMYSN
jgi:hypothetical protein